MTIFWNLQNEIIILSINEKLPLSRVHLTQEHYVDLSG